MSSTPEPVAGGRATVLARVDRGYAKFEDVLNFVAALVVFAMMLFVCAEVFARSALGSSIYGFIDVVELSMAAFAFLGAAHCQRLGGHIRMDLVVGMFRGRSLWFTEAITTLVALIVIGLLVNGTFDHFLRAFRIGDTTIDAEIVTWPSKLIAPVGLAILWLRLLLQFIGYLRLMRNPESDPVAIAPPPGSHAAHEAAEVE